VGVYGGFAGGETLKSERDFAGNTTALSGCNGATCSSRVSHVVTGADDAILDGFVIANGWAYSGAPGDRGAGMYNLDAAPSVANCVFVDNHADKRGGALYNEGAGATGTFASCVFAGNSSGEGGGAVQNRDFAAPTFAGCVFSGNTSPRGGAMYSISDATPTIERCVIAGNSASDRGGGVYGESTSPVTVTDSVVAGNYGSQGGGFHLRGGGASEIVNCSIVANESGNNGGAIQFRDAATSVVVTNSILWNDVPAELFDDGGGTATVTYTDIAGGFTGSGNIDLDPEFAGDVLDSGTWSTVTFDAATWTTTLVDTSAAWTPGALAGLVVLPKVGEPIRLWIRGNTATTITLWGNMTSFAGGGDSYQIHDLHLGPGSPCIDAANGDVASSTDLEGSPRVDYVGTANTGAGTPAYVDMGAYEYQP
jgi:hypothetical protein